MRSGRLLDTREGAAGGENTSKMSLNSRQPCNGGLFPPTPSCTAILPTRSDWDYCRLLLLPPRAGSNRHSRLVALLTAHRKAPGPQSAAAMRSGMRSASAACTAAAQLLLVLVGACSSLQLAGAQDASKHVSGVDLSKATFNQTLLALQPDAYVLMEFFAT